MFRKLREKVESENQFGVYESPRAAKTSQDVPSRKASIEHTAPVVEPSSDVSTRTSFSEQSEIGENVEEDSISDSTAAIPNAEATSLIKAEAAIVHEKQVFQQTIELLKSERDKLKMKVDDLREQLQSFEKAQRERDQLLLRNAELSHQLEQLRSRLSEEQSDKEELQVEFDALKEKAAQTEGARQHLPTIPLKDHKELVQKLEESLADKNKTIRLQQQKISDIKKSLQKGEFATLLGSDKSSAGYWSDTCNDNSDRLEPAPQTVPNQHLNMTHISGSPPATLHINSVSHEHGASAISNAHQPEQINFQYLKNVVFKFITSSEYEAQRHLIKAISVLLEFSDEEEKLVRETLDWKTSWLANLPLVGSNLKPTTSSGASSASALNHRSTKTTHKSGGGR